MESWAFQLSPVSSIRAARLRGEDAVRPVVDLPADEVLDEGRVRRFEDASTIRGTGFGIMAGIGRAVRFRDEKPDADSDHKSQ